MGEMEELDRWALMQLAKVSDRMRRAYENTISSGYYAVHQFCAVDLGAFYLDVLKTGFTAIGPIAGNGARRRPHS